MALPAPLDRLRLPVIVAPMFLTSDPGLVIAACKAGLMGSFPALNLRDSAGLDLWLRQIADGLADHPDAAPFAVNLILHHKNPRLAEDLALVLRPSLIAAGIDPDAPTAPAQARPWRDLWSAGHGVGGIDDIPGVADLARRLGCDYRAAIRRMAGDAFVASHD